LLHAGAARREWQQQHGIAEASVRYIAALPAARGAAAWIANFSLRKSAGEVWTSRDPGFRRAGRGDVLGLHLNALAAFLIGIDAGLVRLLVGRRGIVLLLLAAFLLPWPSARRRRSRGWSSPRDGRAAPSAPRRKP
jgi:hypothetical protein